VASQLVELAPDQCSKTIVGAACGEFAPKSALQRLVPPNGVEKNLGELLCTQQSDLTVRERLLLLRHPRPR